MSEDLLKLGAAFIALLGVMLTLFVNGKRQRESIAETARLQREADERKFNAEIALRQESRSHEIVVARSVIFAQLARVYRTIKGEYEWLANSQLKFVWVALYNTLLPTTESLKRVELLTPDEVTDITAFYYSYHEHMGYIAAASGGYGQTSIKYDFNLIGVDVTAADRELRWLIESLEVLDRKAAAAMDAIYAAAQKAYGDSSPAVQRLARERERNKFHAQKAASFLTVLRERVSEAPEKRRSGDAAD